LKKAFILKRDFRLIYRHEIAFYSLFALVQSAVDRQVSFLDGDLKSGLRERLWSWQITN
jgi:hypothetical protein